MEIGQPARTSAISRPRNPIRIHVRLIAITNPVFPPTCLRLGGHYSGRSLLRQLHGFSARVNRSGVYDIRSTCSCQRPTARHYSGETVCSSIHGYAHPVRAADRSVHRFANDIIHASRPSGRPLRAPCRQRYHPCSPPERSTAPRTVSPTICLATFIHPELRTALRAVSATMCPDVRISSERPTARHATWPAICRDEHRMVHTSRSLRRFHATLRPMMLGARAQEAFARSLTPHSNPIACSKRQHSEPHSMVLSTHTAPTDMAQQDL